MSVSLIDGRIDPDTNRMTPKEALSRLDETVIENLKLKIALSKALEQQIPKKVTHEATLYKCCTCPECKSVVDEFTDFAGERVRVIYNHCRFCGQALDWSDTE